MVALGPGRRRRAGSDFRGTLSRGELGRSAAGAPRSHLQAGLGGREPGAGAFDLRPADRVVAQDAGGVGAAAGLVGRRPGLGHLQHGEIHSGKNLGDRRDGAAGPAARGAALGGDRVGDPAPDRFHRDRRADRGAHRDGGTRGPAPGEYRRALDPARRQCGGPGACADPGRLGQGAAAAAARIGRAAHARPGALGFGIVANAAAWIGYGVALWLLARGVLPAAGLGLVEAIGGFAASYIAGYLFLLAPNGLGVRESVFVIMLEPRIGLANALALAAVSRLGMTAADLLAALPFVRAFREARHAV